MPMQWLVGTSGYSYKEWKGNFYPTNLRAREFLQFYADRFNAVEINNTFYRMPKEETLAGWYNSTPASFKFALKAPQRITHRSRLQDCDKPLQLFLQATQGLKEKRGPLLFQLPPDMPKDAAILRKLLAKFPSESSVAFEFRHPSWLDNEIVEILRTSNAALCISDTDDAPPPEKLVIPTASWGYQRLRRTDYTTSQIETWKRILAGQSWSEAYIFFKHEDEANGPRFAMQFMGAQA